MGQQSSATVVFRALVMLVCLVGIPLVAVFGTSLPEVVKAMLVGTEAEQQASSNMPQHDTTLSVRGGPGMLSADRESDRPLSGRQFDPYLQPPHSGGSLAEPPGSGVISAGYQEQGPDRGGVAIPPSMPRLPRDRASSARVNGASPSGGMLLPGASTNLQPVPHAPQPAAQFSGNPHDPSSGGERFLYIQNRLRQLGATYLLLEFGGIQQPTYRFFCKMSIGGSPSHAETFQASDPAPLEAMNRVLRQVEAWQSTRE